METSIVIAGFGGQGVLFAGRLLAYAGMESGYHVTWRTTFTALDQDVVLDRTPPADEPDGQSWGGYAGMSVRLAKETCDWRIVDSEGRTGMECHRQPARWIRADFARTDTGRDT